VHISRPNTQTTAYEKTHKALAHLLFTDEGHNPLYYADTLLKNLESDVFSNAGDDLNKPVRETLTYFFSRHGKHKQNRTIKRFVNYERLPAGTTRVSLAY
jgi:hypothetical protein